MGSRDDSLHNIYIFTKHVAGQFVDKYTVTPCSAFLLLKFFGFSERCAGDKYATNLPTM